MPRFDSEAHAIARGVVDDLGAAPCAVVGVGSSRDRDGFEAIGAYGRHSVDGPRATAETLFDLASITKSFVAMVAARLAARGELDLRAPLEALLPAARGTSSGPVAFEHFLAHRSGLAAHIPLFLPLTRGEPFFRDEAIALAMQTRRAECVGIAPSEGFAPVYSDMGYLLVGLALESAFGAPLETLLEREVTRPLGLAVGTSRSLGLGARLEEVAPTEIVGFRGGLIHGLVHDENAFALSGDGLSGHAGLFGRAADVVAFGVALRDAHRGRSEWLRPEDLDPFVRARPGGTLRAGFDSRGESPSSGTLLGPQTFGHLGYTGTSLWVDPEAEFVGVLLTNRVHPTRDHWAIRKARPWAYDAMVRAVLAHSAEPRS